MTQPIPPLVHLAFRFHVNLYHSYRGDSLDDRGIGKDIRIIRSLLDALDAFETSGLPIRAAWDIENYHSLEKLLPRHAPDLLDRIRQRVAAGMDEIEPMSFNNGLVTAHTREELEDVLRRTISNPQGSGLADLFSGFAPIVRPQECMFSTSQIPTYRRCGIEAVSLYYSAAPFNGFASFVPPLPFEQRYNPMTLRDVPSGASIRLLPCYSPADIVEHFGSLRRWLLQMRRDQLRASSPRDLLLLIDMDADDSFWEGLLPAFAARLFPSLCGFTSLVGSVADLPWLRFERPYDYLRTHPDIWEISFGQDLADGAFDGYSSWSEKAENVRLWTRIARARRVADLAARISIESGTGDDLDYLAAADRARTSLLLSMSTTHFGMASPVMHVDRLKDGFRWADSAVEAATDALKRAKSKGNVQDSASSDSWYFDPNIDALPPGRGALVQLTEERELHLLNPSSSKEPALIPNVPDGTIIAGPDSLSTGGLEIRLVRGGGVMLSMDGRVLLSQPLSRPWVRYGDKVHGSALEGELAEHPDVSIQVGADGKTGRMRVTGRIFLGGTRDGHDFVRWNHVYTLAAGLTTVRVDLSVVYPDTKPIGYKRARARRLSRTWDARFREVAPFEIVPALPATDKHPARVWKHGFDDTVGSYDLDIHTFGPNRGQDSMNNHLTDGWVAVAAGGKGLLVAQADSAQTLFAFCPMRVRFHEDRQIVTMNPYGSYAGFQWRYPTATTGLGRVAAVLTGDHFDPSAPSWAGESLHASLMLAPYDGDRPPETLQRDALVFATSPEHIE